MSSWNNSSDKPSGPESPKPPEEEKRDSPAGEDRSNPPGSQRGQGQGRPGSRRRSRSRGYGRRPDEAGYNTSNTILPPEPKPSTRPASEQAPGQRSNSSDRRRGQSRGDRSRGGQVKSGQPEADRSQRPPQNQAKPDGERPSQGGRGQPSPGRTGQQSPGQPQRSPDDRRVDGASHGGGRSRRSWRSKDGSRSSAPAAGTTPPAQPQQPRRPGYSNNNRSQRPQTGPSPSRASGHPGRAKTPNNRAPSWGPTDHLPATTPIKARGGIRARSEGGEFGKNWWAKRWLIAMERLMDGARLQRGRRYARMGQVLTMNEAGGGIVARVQGSRPQPYKVSIRISPFTDEQWDKVLDVLADQAIFAAQLLAGEMPANIEDAFSAAGISLFPARGGDLMTDCTCPDWANPCKHIAATHYILGDRFDEDPFLIFRLRGRSQEQILQALRQRRSGQEETEEVLAEPADEPVAPLDANLEHFWQIAPAMERFSVNVQAPSIELPLLKRLGQPDAAGRTSIEENLAPAYEAMSQFALMLAFSDLSRENGENGQDAA